jgi:membrane protease YdiL (CAAX protease family)
MINEIISALLQVILFAFIPFVVYLIKYKKAKGFWNYIGLKKSTTRANLLALLLVAFAAPLFWLTLTNPAFQEIMTDPSSVSGKIRQMGVGIEAIGVILIAAIIKTALAEEIFFRGFVAKRLIAITNFQTGNILQAVIFGAIHTLLFLSVTGNIFFLSVIFIFPAVGAYFKTYLNEKLAEGSIIPGWITHATSNVLSYSIVAFIV